MGKVRKRVNNLLNAKKMENQIWLQHVGYKPAVKAETLKVGDVLMWNWGYTSTITKIIKVSEKSILFETKSDDSGNIHQRRLSKNRLVAKVN